MQVSPFSCALFLPSWDDPSLESTLTTAYPTIPKIWIQQALEQFKGQSASSFGRNIHCSKLHGNRVVLLGDSGHAVTSVLGQVSNLLTSTVWILLILNHLLAVVSACSASCWC